MINGKLHGYFSCSRGVHQGDPLSPLLFCIEEDFLNRFIFAKVAHGDFIPMHYTQNSFFPTHFLYADDVLLFGKVTLHNIRVVNDIFQLYGSLSSQFVNWSKSTIYFGKGIFEARIHRLYQVLNIQRGSLPILYLGVLYL